MDGYDLLSVCPGSERVFQQLCGVLPVDIISLNLMERLPFPLKRTQLSQVLRCYTVMGFPLETANTFVTLSAVHLVSLTAMQSSVD